MNLIIDNEKGFDINVIKTKKFRTIKIELVFLKKTTEKEKLCGELLEMILDESSKKYQNRELIHIERENNFSPTITTNHSLRGDKSFFEVAMTFLSEKHLYKGHNQKCLDFFFELFLNPDIENGQFNQRVFDMVSKKLKFQIESLKENAVRYSINKAEQITNLPIIYREQSLSILEKITPADLANYYYKMINDWFLEISIVGDIDQKVIELVKARFNKRKRKMIPALKYENKSIFKEKIEKGHYSQSELVMIAIVEDVTMEEKFIIGSLFNQIFGASPNSKLFLEIREKKSYCYSVRSYYSRVLNVIIIRSGIGKENYHSVKELIIKQLIDMQAGRFSNEVFKESKKDILKDFYMNQESQSRIININFFEKYELFFKLEKAIQVVKEATKQDIVNFASKIKMRTIFFLEGEK